MTPGDAAALALLVAAVGFTAVAAVGLVRLPDLYSRAHATSKNDTLGTVLALTAAAVVFDDPAATVKLALLVVFVLTTAPTAAHAVARAADDRGVEPWRRPGRESEGTTAGGDPE